MADARIRNHAMTNEPHYRVRVHVRAYFYLLLGRVPPQPSSFSSTVFA